MVGKRDSWVHELPCGTGQHESTARVLYPDRKTVAMDHSEAQSKRKVSLEMGTVLQTATAVVAAPARSTSVPERLL